MLVQQMAAANAHLKILQEPLLTRKNVVAVTSSKIRHALDLLTTSTQEKLVVVSMLLHPSALASPPILLCNRMDPTVMEY